MAVMMTPKEKWTDERLDDLNKMVDQGFAELKAEMKDRFESQEAWIDARLSAWKSDSTDSIEPCGRLAA